MIDLSKIDSLWAPDLAPLLVSEPDDGLISRRWHWTERHLQCVWADNNLRPSRMRSGTGEEVAVIDAGRWNLEAGPDFLDAVLNVGGRTIRGDVEIHIRPSDWTAHHHMGDPRYANVVLHVTWFPAYNVSLSGHITTVALRESAASSPGFSFDAIDLSAYPHAVLPATPRPCAEALADATKAEAQAILESAGLSRLRRKALQIAMRLQETGNRNQVFYEEFMRALGYKANSAAMRYVAEQVPLDRLCAEGDFLSRYALLLGTAGLLPQQSRNGDDSSALIVRRLWDTAWKLGVADSPDCPVWHISGVRPANHPRQRLAAAAVLFAFPDQLLLALCKLPRRSGKDWAEGVYRVISEIMESSAELMTSNIGTRSMIGRQRVNTIIINVLLPLYMAEGIADAEMCRSIPSEAMNQQIKETAYRLFARDHNPAIYATNGLRMQGIIEVCNVFCLSTKSLCADCAFANALLNTIKPQ